MTHAEKTAALAAGIAKIDAFLVSTRAALIANDGSSLEYAYFADETETYWLVSEASLVTLGAGELSYDDWAESDPQAKELGKRCPERSAR